MMRRSLMWIMWPSFLIAALTSGAVFALVDPLDISFFGHFQAVSRQMVYAGGFFLFWIMAAMSSALTFHMAPRGVVLDEFGEPLR